MLANINLQTRIFHPNKKSLKVIRIGTSGSVQSDVPVDSILASTHGLGLDVLMHYYQYTKDEETSRLEKAIQDQLSIPFLAPYLVKAPGNLIDQFSDCQRGITATCSGFYAPQGRDVSTYSKVENLITKLNAVSMEGKKITNFEMETAGIYGLASTFGHQAVSINAIVANRITQEFSKNGQEMVEKTIQYVLEKVIGF
jgi:uridine phosphorylase